ncbi:hypothetical protein ACSBR1_043859 [Camellia fascicularis]
MPRSKIPKWVDKYIDQIGLVLREGRWDKLDVSEIVHVSASGFFEGEMVLLTLTQSSTTSSISALSSLFHKGPTPGLVKENFFGNISLGISLILREFLWLKVI